MYLPIFDFSKKLLFNNKCHHDRKKEKERFYLVMAKNNEGIMEWINYCWEMMNNNPYATPNGYVSHDFNKDLERAVKYKIYHTALYEYQLKLKGMLEEE